MKKILIFLTLLLSCRHVIEKSEGSRLTISGGTEVTSPLDPAFLHTVSILVSQDGKLNHHCTGAIIDRRFVVSAAHCFTYNFDQFKVGYGKNPLANEKINILRFAYPPEYWSVNPGKYDSRYDFILLELESDAPDELTPVLISDQKKDFKKSEAWLQTGYGYSDKNEKKSHYPDFGKLRKITDSKTDDLDRKNRDIFSLTIVNENDRGTQRSDSGGPLFKVTSDKSVILQGTLRSAGTSKRSIGDQEQIVLFSEYTNVAYFKNWMFELNKNSRNKIFQLDSEVTDKEQYVTLASESSQLVFVKDMRTLNEKMCARWEGWKFQQVRSELSVSICWPATENTCNDYAARGYSVKWNLEKGRCVEA